MTNLKPLCKFPISVRQKRHATVNRINGHVTHYETTPSYDFYTKYGYLLVDRGNNVNFVITLNNKTEGKTYIVRIAKEYLYDSIMLSLQHGSIKRNAKRKMFVHKNIKSLDKIKELNNLSPDEIINRFKLVKEEVDKIVPDTSNPTRQRAAEIQSIKLLEQNWKADWFREIINSERLLTYQHEK